MTRLTLTSPSIPFFLPSRSSDVLSVVPVGVDGDFVFVHEGAYVVRLKCPMNFNAFPFDSHECFFEVRRERVKLKPHQAREWSLTSCKGSLLVGLPSLQTFIEKPDTIVSMRCPTEEKDGRGLLDTRGWGWAATTTTIEYVTDFTALPADRLVRRMRSTHAAADDDEGGGSGDGGGGGGGGGGVGVGATVIADADRDVGVGMNVSVAGFRIQLVRKVGRKNCTAYDFPHRQEDEGNKLPDGTSTEDGKGQSKKKKSNFPSRKTSIVEVAPQCNALLKRIF